MHFRLFSAEADILCSAQCGLIDVFTYFHLVFADHRRLRYWQEVK